MIIYIACITYTLYIYLKVILYFKSACILTAECHNRSDVEFFSWGLKLNVLKKGQNWVPWLKSEISAEESVLQSDALSQENNRKCWILEHFGFCIFRLGLFNLYLFICLLIDSNSCNSDWLQTPMYPGMIMNLYPPISTSGMLVLQACSTVPSLWGVGMEPRARTC